MEYTWRWIKDAGSCRSLYDRLREIPDPRSNRKKKHDCAEILTYMVLAYLSGRTALRRAVSWASENREILGKHMELKGGIASAPTVSRLLSGIDEEIFSLTFSDWISQVLKRSGMHIIIDGKALRAATKKIENGNTPYVLNVIDASTQMVLAQMPVGAKTNEITAIPKLIDMLDVEGNIFTIDAIGTQTAIMEKLDNRNAGFVFQVKKNQPQMYDDITHYFRELEMEMKKAKTDTSYQSPMKEQIKRSDRYKTSEKNRERYEYREIIGSRDPSCLTNCNRMPYIRTVGISRQVRKFIVKDADGNDITPDQETFLLKGSIRQPSVIKGDGITDAVQEVGIVSNMELTARKIGEFKRRHWRIENGLHHVLDDVFREDRSPARGSRNNLALIRKIAYNIIRYALTTLDGTKGVIGMMDWFADDPVRAVKYIFTPLECLSCLVEDDL